MRDGPTGSAPSSPSRSRAGSLLLGKFQALDVLNKELQVENTSLLGKVVSCWGSRTSAVFHATSRRSIQEFAPNKVASRASSKSSSQKDGNFDFFCQQLTAMGVDAASVDAQQDLQALFLRVQAQEAQISKTGGRLLLQYSVLRIYLLAKIAGSERCLIEHDRFDLRSAKQKTLMIPLEIRMREGENWREATRRGLKTMVGLQSDLQDQSIILDENSYIEYKESSSAHNDTPSDFLVSITVHEIHAKVRQHSFKSELEDGIGESPETEEALNKIGLPNGRDFVYCEESHNTVHVWCWKSREYEQNGMMKAFEKYLADHGIDTKQLGVGNNKTLFKFYRECKEEQLCSLIEVPAEPGAASPKLVRVLRILKIKLIAVVNRRKRVLMENEKYDACGKRRANAGQLIIRKLTEFEDWQAAVQLAISDRIGVNLDLQTECFKVDHSKMVYKEEEVPSKGFVGIMSKYKLITVPVYVMDPHHKDMLTIGLPRGSDFVSKEYKDDSDAPQLHVWSWAPAVDEEDAAQGNFAGTALETLNRDLYDVEHVLTQAIADPQLAGLGLDKPFKTSLQKLKKCAEGITNIDKMVRDVDIDDIMGGKGKKAGTGTEKGDEKDGSMKSELKSFLEANFTRSVQPEEASQTSARRMSFAAADQAAGGSLTDSGTIECFDNLFVGAPEEVKFIVEGRNDWTFDFFKLADEFESGVSMLECYADGMLVPYCIAGLGCTEESAHKFVSAAASSYLEDNPYHGPIHAAQVCHLSRWLTKAMRVMEKQSELESTAFMLAAFCHDIKHIGRNNNFCVVSEHPLALIYNNRSVMERYHSSTCLELLQTSELLKDLSLKDRSTVRSHIIENILATDMAEHFETISKFRVRRESQDFSLTAETDRRFVARLCLKAGDLGHACLPWLIHVNWAKRVLTEFYSQGEEEARLGLPISALCDRKDVGNLPNSQRGFLNFVVAPLYQVLSESQPSSENKCKEKPAEELEEEPKQAVSSLVVPGERRDSSGRQKRRLPSTGLPLNSTEVGLYEVEKCCTKKMHDNAQRWLDDEAVVTKLRLELNPLWTPAPEPPKAC